jgi:hypothetical protein
MEYYNLLKGKIKPVGYLIQPRDDNKLPPKQNPTISSTFLYTDFYNYAATKILILSTQFFALLHHQ